MRVLNDEIRPGEPLDVELAEAGRITLSCTVGGNRLLRVEHAGVPGRNRVVLPPGPCSHAGEVVSVEWHLETTGRDPLQLPVLPGTSSPPTPTLAEHEPLVRGVVRTLMLGAFVLVIVGVAGWFLVLDPGQGMAVRVGAAVVLAGMLAWFAWLPVTTVLRWLRSLTVPAATPRGPLRPGAAWAPRAGVPWRLDRVESRYVAVTRGPAGGRYRTWTLREHRVTVATGGPEDALHLPPEGPVNARAGRAAVHWEWVGWREGAPHVERRVKLDVR